MCDGVPMLLMASLHRDGMLMLLLILCLPAVPRCHSAMGTVCLLGSFCCALGILCACDFALTHQVLGTSVYSEK